MSKLAIIGVAALTVTAVVLFGRPPANAEAPATGPEPSFEITSMGAHLKVYEFIPKAAPRNLCVLFVSGGKKMGLDCFRK